VERQTGGSSRNRSSIGAFFEDTLTQVRGFKAGPLYGIHHLLLVPERGRQQARDLGLVFNYSARTKKPAVAYAWPMISLCPSWLHLQ